MAEVIHRYVGRDAAPDDSERAKLDAEWKRKRIDAESARQKLHAAKLLAMKGELISKKHVTKQAAFLVLSLRARLLAIASKHARELSEISDEREMALRLDAIMRSSLDEIAQMPLKVSDEHWIETLDDERDSTNQRRRSDADRLLFDVVFERPLSLEMQRRRDEVVLAREESFSRLVIRRFCFRNLDLGRLHFAERFVRLALELVARAHAVFERFAGDLEALFERSVFAMPR